MVTNSSEGSAAVTKLGLCTSHTAVTKAAASCAKISATCCAPDIPVGALLHNQQVATGSLRAPKLCRVWYLCLSFQLHASTSLHGLSHALLPLQLQICEQGCETLLQVSL